MKTKGLRMFRIVCSGTTKRNRLCDRLLGAISITPGATSHFYCRDCKHVYQFHVKPDGCIERRIVPENMAINYDASIVMEGA